MEKRKDVISRAERMKVVRTFSGKRSFFKVFTAEGKEKEVSLQVQCADCEYRAIQGTAHGEICSHIHAVLMQISRTGSLQYIDWSNDEMTKAKRNEARNLLQTSNIRINEVRISSSESQEHIILKIAVCRGLVTAGKEFVTEAIFKTGPRADIFILDDFLAIEIAVSESEDSLEEKKKSYPRGVKMMVIRHGNS